MQAKIILPAIALAMLANTPAFAGDRCSEPRSSWMSEDALRAKAEEQGYKVKRITEEDGCFEIYALNATGERTELYINPKTGEIVHKKANN